MARNQIRDDPTRVAIVGCGDMGGKHADQYLKLWPSVELVAVFDTNHARAEEFARRWTRSEAREPGVYDTLAELLDHAHPDAVSVCVPNTFHAGATLAALEVASVFCEKPPALTVEDAQRMADAARNAGRTLTYNLRFLSMVDAGLKAFVAEGGLGEIYLAHALWRRRSGVPGWGIYGNKALQGGGAWYDLGPHALVAWFLMGCPKPTSVSARTYNHLGKRKRFGILGASDPTSFEVEDTAVVTVQFPKATLIIEVAFALNGELPHAEEFVIELFGSAAGLRIPFMTWDSPDLNVRDFRPRLYREGPTGSLTTERIDYPLPVRELGGYELAIRNFIAACRGEAQPFVTPEQGIELTRMLVAGYESAERGGDTVSL